MELYRAEYMVGGTSAVAIESDCINVRAWGRLAMRDPFFQLGKEAQKKI